MPGSPFPQSVIRDNVSRAIQRREAENALRWAKGLKSIGLDQVLDITLLLAHEDDPRYPKAARRFLVRFIGEAEPKLLTLKKVIDALNCIERVRYFPDMTDEADKALRDLARQLAARDRR